MTTTTIRLPDDLKDRAAASWRAEGGALRVARIELAPGLGDDFDRTFDHLARRDVDGAPSCIRAIVDAISILETSPMIGRPAAGAVANDLRASIIGKHTHGYVALHRYAAAIDTVFVLALRSQREAGCSP